jgi:adenylate kinase family enzyme
MKIYITGCMGSGKTSLARQLTTHYKIQTLFLDDIFWKVPYEESYSEAMKKKKLTAFLDEYSQWVIEGVYTSFTGKALREADFILFLNPPLHVLMYRIISRHLKARFSGKKEPFPKQLVKDIFAYKRGGLLCEKQQQMLQDHKHKTITVTRALTQESLLELISTQVESYKNKEQR